MPAPYGVTATGFSTKTLAEQIAELELAEQAVFGAGVVVDSQSPLGQINGVFADALSELWEMAQALYGASDVDQAVGARLDSLAKLRGLTRPAGMSDSDFRALITQDSFGTIRARNIRNALLAVAGVTSVQVLENNTSQILPSGLSPHSLAIIVQGGTDADVATAIWENTVPGIGLQGNTPISLTIDGFCRTMSFVRPDVVELSFSIDVSQNLDNCACAPAGTSDIITNLIAGLTDECGIGGGTTLTPNDVIQALGGTDGINVEGVQMARDGKPVEFQSIALSVFEVPNIDPANVTIQYIEATPPPVSGPISGGFGQGTIV